jgi:hypothetical protein
MEHFGYAIEIMRDDQSGEVTSLVPTTKGCGTPLMIAPGRNERVLLFPTERTLPDEDHEIVLSSWVRGSQPRQRAVSVC